MKIVWGLDDADVAVLYDGLTRIIVEDRGPRATRARALRNRLLNTIDMERAEALENAPYRQRGYRNREHYLKSLADEYNVSEREVMDLATVIKPEDDFEELVEAVSAISEQNNII